MHNTQQVAVRDHAHDGSHQCRGILLPARTHQLIILHVMEGCRTLFILEFLAAKQAQRCAHLAANEREWSEGRVRVALGQGLRLARVVPASDDPVKELSP